MNKSQKKKSSANNHYEFLFSPPKINKHSYKEPVFLFTSCSLRHAAYAGWYSAFGDEEQTEKWVHSAHAEWAKELGAGRRYSFLGYHSNDIWKHVKPAVLKKLVDNFLKEIKREVKKGKIQFSTPI